MGVNNYLLIIFAFAILLVAIIIGLGAGALAKSSTEFSDNWEDIRDEIRVGDPDFCYTKVRAVEDGACLELDSAYYLEDQLNGCTEIEANVYYDVDEDTCVEKVKDLVQSNMSVVGILCLSLSIFMVVIVFFTLKAIRIWHSGTSI